MISTSGAHMAIHGSENDFEHAPVTLQIPRKKDEFGKRKPFHIIKFEKLPKWYLDIRVPQHTSFSRYEPTSK
ncbi:hypothetical protein CDAR_567951 [Caerostris darwini]|uniref:Uncharacterized protein n=1 Tax=Caerostris darwini TaxID=1538125 RepID=A0AAV4SI00_9ARAC|nr:hypothetical protein CDAR_567951 [Caerostris darwini]